MVQAHMDVQSAWREYKRNKTPELKNQLIQQYLPLVKYTAERVWSKLPDEVEVDDLFSAGVFGLMAAVDGFKPERGFKFETYCAPRIRGAILDYLRSVDWVPRLVRSRSHKLDRALVALEAKLGRKPSEEETAEYMSMSMPEYHKLVRDATAVTQSSLSKKCYETDGNKDVREIDILDDKRGEDPMQDMQLRDIKQMITRGLNKTERLIIILYYYENLTMKEIGATLELSESRVSQMHSSIILRLKGQLADRRSEFAA